MPKKSVLFFIITILVLGTVSLLANEGKAQTLATVYIHPEEVTGINIGDNFTINVNVANISGFAGWEIQLFYSSQVLNAISVVEGPFLRSVQNTIFLSGLPLGIDNSYNSTHGRVYLACAILGTTEGASGTGTLTNITFRVVGAGLSVLALPEATTKILDNTPANPQPIPHTVVNGLVTVVGADLAITSIQLVRTIVGDTQMNINVTAANLGNFSASFNVTLYYDSTEIATQTVAELAPSTSIILSFEWNTTPIPKGNYTISAYAPPVIGENNIENNRLIDGWIVETIPGDLNGDGEVNILDISIVARAFLSEPGSPKWDPNADLDNNGSINILDISRVAKEFGKKDP